MTTYLQWALNFLAIILHLSSPLTLLLSYLIILHLFLPLHTGFIPHSLLMTLLLISLIEATRREFHSSCYPICQASSVSPQALGLLSSVGCALTLFLHFPYSIDIHLLVDNCCQLRDAALSPNPPKPESSKAKASFYPVSLSSYYTDSLLPFGEKSLKIMVCSYHL